MRCKNLIRSVIGVGLLIAFAGCAPAQDEPTTTPSLVPATQVTTLVETATEAWAAETPTVHATSEPTSTFIRISETPTVTSTPSITPTFSTIPTSTVPLVEGGPWLIFKAAEDPREHSKLWAMNTDGTGLTKLIDEPVYRYEIRPAQTLSSGLTIAYLTGTPSEHPSGIICDKTLKIVDVPSGVVQVSIPPLNADIQADCRNTQDVAWAIGKNAWSPDGTKLAFVGASVGPSADINTYTTGTPFEHPDGIICDKTLKIVDVPSGVVQVSIPLLNADIQADCRNAQDVAWASGENAWSPDGTKLAFIGASDGPSADVYTYDLSTGTIIRLSDGPDHANILSWSPDGRYVIHTATSPQEPGVYGIWAARSDGTGNVPLFDELPHCAVYYGQPSLDISEHWLGPDSVLLVNRVGSGNSPDNNVRLVDLDTGEITYIRRCCFEEVAYDSKHNIWLFIVQDSEDAPTHLVFWESGVERKIDVDADLSYVWWSEGVEAFIGFERSGSAYRISITGELEPIQIPDGLGIFPFTYTSPDGEWYYWIANYIPQSPQPGLWMAKPGQEPVLVLDEMVESVFWSPDNSEMYIVSYHEEEMLQPLYNLYRLNLPSLEPELLLGDFYPYSHFEWVP